MKIITEDAVYVQKNDFAFLNQSDLTIPASIYLQALDRGIITIGNDNRYDFFKFTEPHEIEFFKEIDWIIDYYDIKDLSIKDIFDLANKISDERRDIAFKYNSMTAAEKENNIHLFNRAEFLNYQLYSLRDFVWFKQGKLKFKLPEGISLPNEFFDDSITDNTDSSITKKAEDIIQGETTLEEVSTEPENNGLIKKFLKTIFKRKR